MGKLTRKKEPYELLVRWRNGEISGAHVGFIEIVRDGDEVIAHKELGVEPISEKTDFPLSAVLAEIHVTALATTEMLRAKNVELLSEKFDLAQQVDKANISTAGALDRVKELEGKLKLATEKAPK